MNKNEREELLTILEDRFDKNMNRHEGLTWAEIRAKLEANSEKLWSLNEMEKTGGEPDVVGRDEETGAYIFMIVRRKVLTDVEAFAMIAKGWSHGKSLSLKITRLIWQPAWVLNCLQKKRIAHCRS